MDHQTVQKPSFEESYPEINAIIQSRRGAWNYVSVVEWQDISQILLLRVFEKWDKFDPSKGPLEHWVNRLATNAILNAKRDQGGARWSRPCVGGGRANGKSCTFNTGSTTCSYTPSGKQCSECVLYADWQRTREHQFNIKSTVALDNHAQEVSNIQEDFHDYDGIKNSLDEHMRKELTKWEYKVYVMLYIRHLTPTMTSTELQNLVKKWKRAPREDEQTGYQAVLQYQRRFKEMMLEILSREGHIDT